MSAALTADQVRAVGERFAPRSFAWQHTRRSVQPVKSTFTDGAVRGGATWLHEDGGRVVMVRVSPRRVMLDLQTLLSRQFGPLSVDGVFGPQTQEAMYRLTGLAPGTPPLSLWQESLRRLYHAGRGQVLIPMPAQLPNARDLREVRGDATYYSAVVVGPDAESAAEVPATAAAAPSVAPAPGDTAALVQQLEAMRQQLAALASTQAPLSTAGARTLLEQASPGRVAEAPPPAAPAPRSASTVPAPGSVATGPALAPASIEEAEAIAAPVPPGWTGDAAAWVLLTAEDKCKVWAEYARLNPGLALPGFCQARVSITPMAAPPAPARMSSVPTGLIVAGVAAGALGLGYLGYREWQDARRRAPRQNPSSPRRKSARRRGRR